MASSLICPGQIKSGATGWLAGLTFACLSCRGVYRIGLAGEGVLGLLCMGSFWRFWQCWQDNRTAPGDPFTLEKARAPTSQTRVSVGQGVGTYPT